MTPTWKPAITLGFAASLAMWTVGFVARLPGVQASTFIVVDLFGVVLITAGAIAGGLSPRARALRTGAATGLVAGFVNLLILGAVLSDPGQPNSLRADWWVMLGAWLLGAPILALLGAGAGAAMRARRAPLPDAPPPNWHGWLATTAAAATLILLLVGGLVTSLEAGLAVPDWPNSFGFNMFLYPLSHMQGGRYFEHSHRLFGTLVGLTTIAFLVWTFLEDRRRSMRALAVFALVFVIAQGLLGALRVTGRFTLSQTETAPNNALAIVHGVSGQLFFAYMCCLAAVASSRWKRADAQNAPPADPAKGVRGLATLFLAFMILQLLLGALTRHTDVASKGYLHVALTHALNALVVTGFAVAAGARAARFGAGAGERAITRVGKAAMHTVGLQVLLGALALWVVLATRGRAEPGGLEVALATGHQTVGALLLGLAAMLFAWSRRLIRKP